MKKRLASILALAMVFSALSVNAMAMDTDSAAKTITVYSTDGADAIQKAVDRIAAEGDNGGWTITVKAGTYDRFTVPHGVEGLTIQGEDKAAVVIETLKETAANSLRDSGGINIFGTDTTLKNLTITAGSVKTSSFTAAVSTHDGMAGGKGVSLTVENCVITGSGVGDGILFDCPSFQVRDCEITSFVQAIEFYGDNWVVPEAGIGITGNTITNCSFALHGYFGGGEGGGVMTVANNRVSGTEALRAKIVIQDNTQSDNGAIKADVRGNTLVNAVVGLVNLRGTGETVSDVLTSNTMGVSSYYVEAVEPGTIEFYSRYNAPEGSKGHWVLTGLENVEVDWGNNPEGALEYIKSAIDEANANGSHTLTITGIDEENLIKSFTWFKDAVYWVCAGKDSEPGLDKKVETTGKNGKPVYEDVIGKVPAGSTLVFTLNSTLPTDLALKVGTNNKIPASVTSDLTFYDKMTNLKYADSLTVTIGEGKKQTELSAGQYTLAVAQSSDYFTVKLDLVALFNDGVITLDQLKKAEPVVVRYSAAVTGSANSKLNNEAWVNNSTHDTTPGEVPGGEPTGGTGTAMFTVGGVCLTAAACTLFLISRRKEKNI